MHVNPITLREDLSVPWILGAVGFCLSALTLSAAGRLKMRFPRLVLTYALVILFIYWAVFVKYLERMVRWSVLVFVLVLSVLIGWSVLQFKYWRWYRAADPFTWAVQDEALARQLRAILIFDLCGTVVALLIYLLA